MYGGQFTCSLEGILVGTEPLHRWLERNGRRVCGYPESISGNYFKRKNFARNYYE